MTRENEYILIGYIPGFGMPDTDIFTIKVSGGGGAGGAIYGTSVMDVLISEKARSSRIQKEQQALSQRIFIDDIANTAYPTIHYGKPKQEKSQFPFIPF